MRFFLYKFVLYIFLHNKNENHIIFPEHFYQFSLSIYKRQIIFFSSSFSHIQKISWLISNIKCHPVAPSQTLYINHVFMITVITSPIPNT